MWAVVTEKHVFASESEPKWAVEEGVRKLTLSPVWPVPVWLRKKFGKSMAMADVIYEEGLRPYFTIVEVEDPRKEEGWGAVEATKESAILVAKEDLYPTEKEIQELAVGSRLLALQIIRDGHKSKDYAWYNLLRVEMAKAMKGEEAIHRNPNNNVLTFTDCDREISADLKWLDQHQFITSWQKGNPRNKRLFLITRKGLRAVKKIEQGGLLEDQSEKIQEDPNSSEPEPDMPAPGIPDDMIRRLSLA